MDWDDCGIKLPPPCDPDSLKPSQPGQNRSQTAEDELPLADDIAMETAAQGTAIEYYEQDMMASEVDDLYNEPISRVFRLYRLMGVVEWPDSTPEMVEGGARTSFMTTVSIPRKAFELAGATAPSEGDVLRFWNTPFFDDFSVDGAEVPNAGYYFDVGDVDDDGHINDSEFFVWFKMSCKRRTDYTPERRILDE